MSQSFVYWALMFFWLLSGFFWNRPAWMWPLGPSNWLLFILLALVGWRVFGAPIHG